MTAVDWLAARDRQTVAIGMVALAVAFMATTSVYDAYRRLGPGRFISDSVLNVIYGPANRQYYSVNLPALMAAPVERRPIRPNCAPIWARATSRFRSPSPKCSCATSS